MKLKKIVPAIAAAVVFLCTAVFSTVDAYAMTAQASIWATKYTCDIGEQIIVNYAVQSSAASWMQANISVSGGVAIISVAPSGNDNYNNGVLLSNNGSSPTHSGQITVRFDSPGSKTITISNIKLGSETNPDDTCMPSPGSVTVYVRTAEEKAAADASYEAYQSSVAEEQWRRSSQEAARQASINASIAASASAEQSWREASEAESLYHASIEESIRESEAAVEATRPTEIGELKYARLVIPAKNDGTPEKVFYMALSDQGLPVPEGYRSTALIENEQSVYAYRTGGMSRGTYLVYGFYEGEDVPKHYYLNTAEGLLFPYEYLHSDSNMETEETTEEPVEETTESSGEDSEPATVPPRVIDSFDSAENQRKVIAIGVFALLLGAALATLIAVLVRKKQNAEPALPYSAFHHRHYPERDTPSGNRKLDPEGFRLDFEEMEDEAPKK